MSSRSRPMHSTSSRRSSGAQYKKFTFKQIQEKVAERWEIPEYYDILMEAAVKEESDGIQFNLKHPSFQKLIKLVKEHDVKRKQKEHKSKTPKRSKGSSSRHQSSKSGGTTTNTSSSSRGHSNHHRHDNDHHDTPKLRVLNRSRKSTKKVKSQQEWLDILTEQLSSHSPNAKVVRESCRHVGIPINLRATIWKILLNVPKKKAKLFQRQNKDYQSPIHRSRNQTRQKHDHHHNNINHNNNDHDDDNNNNDSHSTTTPDRESQHTRHGHGTPTPSSTDGTTVDAVNTTDSDDSHSVPHQGPPSRAPPLSDPVANAMSASNHSSNHFTSRPMRQHFGVSDFDFEPLRDDPPPLYNQRVIQADIERTRPTMKCFQDSAVRQEMEIILTEYCHRKKVSYKQGMNYVLAPFLMIAMKDRLDIYLCFESFIETYLNSTFNDEEFGSLQCIFRMFRLLMQYHDPMLSSFLDHHEIMPELFASGWFMTVHANKCDQATLLHVWDEILLENDAVFHYYVDLEILRHNRDDILKRSQEELPQFLVNLVIDDRDYARRLLKAARKTLVNTPASYHEMLTKCAMEQIVVDSVDYVRLEKLPCLSIEPKELIGHCYAETLLLHADDYSTHIPPPTKPKNERSMPRQSAANGSDPNQPKKTKSSKTEPRHDDDGGDVGDASPVGGSGDVHGSGKEDRSKKFKFNMKRKGGHKKDKSGSLSLSNHTPLQPPPPVPEHATPSGGNEDEDSSKKKYSRKVRKLLKQSTKYAEQKHLKFFILDCRSLEEYEAGHLPCAFWIDPTLEVSSERLREKLKSLLEMKGCHFVLFFDGRHNSSDQLLLNNNDPLEMIRANDVSAEEYLDEQQLFRQSLLYFFLEKKCKYISICESGYAGCHELVVGGNLEMIDHVPERCIECNGKWKNSLLSSVRGRFNAMISVAGGSMEKLRNRMIESRSHHNHNHKTSGSSTLSSRAPSMSQYLTAFTLPNNFDRKSIDAEFAGNIHLCRNEPLLMIYLSILRDRNTTNVDRVQDVTHKMLVVMFSQILEHHFDGKHSVVMELRFDFKECWSPLDISYGSLMCQRGIYGVCLNDSCENALQNLLLSFQPVLRSVIGTLTVEESFIEDEDGILRSNRQAVALMPKDIDQRIVIIFHDSITQQNANNELQSAIDALLKLGAKEQNVIVIALIASRLAAVGLVKKFPKLHIWCACFDAVHSQSGSKLIPGIGVFQNRYKFKKSKHKKTPNSRKRAKKDDDGDGTTTETVNGKVESTETVNKENEAQTEGVNNLKEDIDSPNEKVKVEGTAIADDSNDNIDDNADDPNKEEATKGSITASARCESDHDCE